MLQRDANYYAQVRQAVANFLRSYNTLKDLQLQWNALDYGNAQNSDRLPNGDGVNEGITAAQVGAAVFDTANAVTTLLGQGHATNLARLL